MREKKTMCPQCGAVAKKKKSRLKYSVLADIIKSLIFVDPCPGIKQKNVYHCSNCGYEWTE